MALRLVITDAAWAEREPAWRAMKPYAGSPPQLSDRMFIEAVLYQARTGIPWRDLPGDCGNWGAVSNRLRRWEARQLWKRLWPYRQHNGCQLAQQVFIDSTIMRVHQHAAGARKKTGGQRPRLLAALGVEGSQILLSHGGLGCNTHRRPGRRSYGHRSEVCRSSHH